MAKGPQWLDNALFYQIYPQSFYDTNSDGIGDIPGIIEKLDYVKSLGCNAIWVNPCFESPFLDAGYDVADFYKVAPRYGTNADLKRLFKTAAKKGIRVLLDLVAGHTSVENKWFQESAKHEPNEYSNWYIWTNDWLESSATAGEQGLNTVNGYSKRNGCYVTNFFWSQPALNYGFAKPDPKQPWQLPVDHPHVKAMRKEMKNVIRYWLDMGASGFRVDMAGSLVKNDPGWKKTSEFWQDVRKMLDKDYPEAAMISEWSYPAIAIKAGFHMDFLLHCETPAYTSLLRQEAGTNVLSNTEGNSFFRKAGLGNIQTFVDSYTEHFNKTKNKGYISLPSGNHDLPRVSLGRTQREQELVFAFLLTMPGVPFIYYGDEIGMNHLDLPSKESGYNRTGARTPMQWAKAKNAGFSKAKAADLYLPIDPRKNYTNVADQENSPSSLLNKVRSLTALRHSNPALSNNGDFKPLYAKKNTYPFVYLRQKGKEKFIVAVNPSGKAVDASFALATKNTPELQMGKGVEISTTPSKVKLTMPPISYAIYKV